VAKETLLQFWHGVVAKTALRISLGERLENIQAVDGGFTATTNKRQYKIASVLLAIGRRGTPRKLEVPGEELSKVVYRLIDAEQYRLKRVLVVGGGDSAVEAALACAAVGAKTDLSYRGDAFSRLKPANRDRLQLAQKKGELAVWLNSQVLRIEEKSVLISGPGGEQTLANDAVIISVGGVLPAALLKSIGVMVDTKFGTR
jgi:thioredoxin reductase (NADPH)